MYKKSKSANLTFTSEAAPAKKQKHQKNQQKKGEDESEDRDEERISFEAETNKIKKLFESGIAHWYYDNHIN